MNRYIVIVYPAPVSRDDQSKTFYQMGSVQTNLQPQVSRTTARSPEMAADGAKVPAGGYALVIDERRVDRFDRAAIAPLEARAVDGNPRATVVADRA